jgi:hypothetical protein
MCKQFLRLGVMIFIFITVQVSALAQNEPVELARKEALKNEYPILDIADVSPQDPDFQENKQALMLNAPLIKERTVRPLEDGAYIVTQACSNYEYVYNPNGGLLAIGYNTLPPLAPSRCAVSPNSVRKRYTYMYPTPIPSFVSVSLPGSGSFLFDMDGVLQDTSVHLQPSQPQVKSLQSTGSVKRAALFTLLFGSAALKGYANGLANYRYTNPYVAPVPHPQPVIQNHSVYCGPAVNGLWCTGN